MKMNKALIKRMFITALAAFAVVFSAGCGTNSATDEEIKQSNVNWGEGITENIPEFPAGNGEIVSANDGSYVSAYYSNVSGDQIKEYISALEQECGVKFNGEKYPLTASIAEKTIILHYNVTEMQFSVTVIKTQG